MTDAPDRIAGTGRTGIRRLAVQLAFAVTLVGLVWVGTVVEAVPYLLVLPVAAALPSLYFAVEDPERRGYFVRIAVATAVGVTVAGVAMRAPP